MSSEDRRDQTADVVGWFPVVVALDGDDARPQALGASALLLQQKAAWVGGMKLPLSLYDDIKRHAFEEAPRECCGIAAVVGDRVVAVFRTANVATDPRSGFLVESDDQRWVLEALARNEWEPAVYHSHPTAGPFPSLADMRMAAPWPLHLIVGMGRGLVTKAWEISGDGALEHELVLC